MKPQSTRSIARISALGLAIASGGLAAIAHGQPPDLIPNWNASTHPWASW